jgi:hypothetical protein
LHDSFYLLQELHDSFYLLQELHDSFYLLPPLCYGNQRIRSLVARVARDFGICLYDESLKTGIRFLGGCPNRIISLSFTQW